jgi:Flp pilus assembly protein TadG
MKRVGTLNMFARDQRGSTAIIFGFALIPMVGFVGAALDGARWYKARRETGIAIDSAVLVAARHMQINPNDTVGAIATAQSYYANNTSKRTGVINDTVIFKLTSDNNSVTTEGGATIKTYFLPVVGIRELQLAPQATASQSSASFRAGLTGRSNLELSLMLDVTGSMCDDGNGPCTTGTKIDGLRTAAADLVNIVVQDVQSPYTSRVAIVPFSTRIRVELDSGDGSMMKKLTNLNPTWTGWNLDCPNSSGTGGGEGSGTWTCLAPGWVGVHKVNWKILPCVTERAYNNNAGWVTSPMDMTDDAPGSGKWFNAHGGDRSPIGNDSSNTVMATTSDGQTQARAASQWNYDTSAYCDDVPDENMIVPLSPNKTMLQSKISQLSAGGATAGAGATAWSWYMLSPKWSSIWTGASTPGSYADVTTVQTNGSPILRKVAVLMTDGAFNAFRSSKDENATVISNNAKQLCTNMKAQGIEIYTVGFALNQLTATERPIAEDMLKSCGTDISHFYSSLTVSELQTAFRDIALKVTPVRLTH